MSSPIHDAQLAEVDPATISHPRANDNQQRSSSPLAGGAPGVVGDLLTLGRFISETAVEFFEPPGLIVRGFFTLLSRAAFFG